ncbi:sugar ABC transporter ATP-binding protein [Deltaproteobacteria bacterium OttesenSCG-928-M10]|nr:sugar ABC transporter ATP-binding protein [Deltaproteobacteria bacterium OttesenSCG-928-M10]
MADNNDFIEFRCEAIGKSYGSSRVLDNVGFSVAAGEVVGLVGENGAGKSTLMNICFGMPAIVGTGGYDGQLYLNDEPVKFLSPNQALAAGIGMVHQEFSLIPGFTGTENILLNREPLKRGMLESVFGERINALDRPEMENRASAALGKLGIKLDQETPVSQMPVGHKQFLEIAREIDRSKTRLLVLDEPTAVLTESEASILLSAVRKLAEQGMGIIFISHRLREVMELCRKVVVLRDGRKVAEMPTSRTSIREIASYMVQREGSRDEVRPDERDFALAPVSLKIRDLWVDMPGEMVRDVTLDIMEGEIFGLAGLAGQGKLGVPAGIMGLKPAGGRVEFRGRELPLNDPEACLAAGVAFVSEDRRGVGLLLDESIQMNIGFTAMQIKREFLKKYGPFVLMNDRGLKENALKYIDILAIKTTGPLQKAGHLSGGNQQKVCLAKAFTLAPELLFVSEPTRGIDVGAKELVLDSLKRYNREAGTTVVVVSSELEELRSVCHRIAVISEGRVAGILPAEAPAEKFGFLMSGEDIGDDLGPGPDGAGASDAATGGAA